MGEIDSMNEEINRIFSMDDINAKKREAKRRNNILIIVGLALILLIALVINISYNMKRSGNFGDIMKSVEKVFRSNSYIVSDEVTIFDGKDNLKIYTFNTETVKKDNNIRLTGTFRDNNDNVYDFGGLFITDERAELITNEESYFVKYQDILKVVSEYLPSLKELCDDLSKISEVKYEGIIRKNVSDLIKNINLESCYNLTNEIITDNIKKDEEKTNIMIDGKLYELERYYIELSARDMIKNKINILMELKNNSDIRRCIKNINQDILYTIEKSKDYTYIRMTSEEFASYKLKYANILIDSYDELLTKKIEELEKLYSIISSSQNESYSIYVDQYGEVRQIITNSVTIVNDKVFITTDKKLFDKVGSVKSKDIVPKDKKRINLSSLDRSELFTTIEQIKYNYEDLKNLLDEEVFESIDFLKLFDKEK